MKSNNANEDNPHALADDPKAMRKHVHSKAYHAAAKAAKAAGHGPEEVKRQAQAAGRKAAEDWSKGK